jgi:hypothetical protein
MQLSELKLNSFSDTTIARAMPMGDGTWYAEIDVGHDRRASDPDFGRFAPSREQAIERCAAAIRHETAGLGLFLGGTTLGERLLEHWTEKAQRSTAD